MPSHAPSMADLGDRLPLLVARHMERAFRDCVKGPAVTLEPRFIRAVTGEPSPLGNFAFLADSGDIEGVQEAIDPLRTVAAPCSVMMKSLPSQAVAEVLADAGFELAVMMPLMAVDIPNLAATALPDGYRFVRLTAWSDIEPWMGAMAEAYGLPLEVALLFDFSSVGGAANAPIQCFSVMKGERHVATSVLMLADGVAGIYCVATMPEERGKGLGAHVTAEPLRIANSLGYGVGVLQSSSAGHGVYERLGFADVGKIPMYVRLPG